MGFLDKVTDSLGGIVGGVLGLGSTALGNDSAKHEAQANRDFQEEMSNTAVQRRVQDLNKAGLNPLLAVQNASSGASTPSGATADVKHFDPNSINLLSNARLLNAQAKQIENDNNLQNEKRQALILENRLRDARFELMKAQTDGERANIIQKSLQNQGIIISNKQAYEVLDKLRMTNDIYRNGFTTEMSLRYPGLFSEMVGKNSNTLTSSVFFNSANALESFFDLFNKKTGGNGGSSW